MRYFFDTEFSENGPGKPIVFISIGIVTEDDEGNIREYYAVSNEFDKEELNPWVKKNIIPKLKVDKKHLKNNSEIAKDILEFTKDDPKPMFVANYCAYDWVVLCQLFGAMIDLPDKFPMFCLDVQQFRASLNSPIIPKAQNEEDNEHNSLFDARETKRKWDYLTKYKWLGKTFNLKELRNR